PVTGAIRYLQGRRPARFQGVGGAVPSNVLSMRYGLQEAGGYDLPIERRYDTLWRRVMSPEVPTQSGFFIALPLSLPRVDERRLPARARRRRAPGVDRTRSGPRPRPRLQGRAPRHAGRRLSGLAGHGGWKGDSGRAGGLRAARRSAGTGLARGGAALPSRHLD